MSNAAAQLAQHYRSTFHASSASCRGKLRWILSVAVRGTLWIDNGALAAVLDKRKSLFAVGIIKVPIPSCNRKLASIVLLTHVQKDKRPTLESVLVQHNCAPTIIMCHQYRI